MASILCLIPPSPPGMIVGRDYAGGYGTASSSARSSFGFDDDKFPLMHPSVLTCAALLEEKHQVTIIDGQIERLNLEQLSAKVAAIKPEYVLSVINLPSLEGDIKTLQAIRAACSPKAIIAFGTVCRIEHQRILKSTAADILLLGDPEVQILPLFDAVVHNMDCHQLPGVAFSDDNKAIKTEGQPMITDLDSLPFPAYHLIPVEKYQYHELPNRPGLALVYTSKGCPFACGYYCPYPYGFGKKVIFRDPVKVVDEIETLNKRFGVQTVLFRDQVFTVKRKHAEQICEEIVKRGLDIRWVCETKYDRVDRELLKLMKSAGCHSVHYGLESGDEEIFWKIGKPGGKTPENAMEKFRQTISETKQAGIIAHTHTIIGLPGESWNSVKTTLNRIRQWGVQSVQAAIITPYPGTKLYEDARQNGWLKTNSPDAFSGFKPVMEFPDFSSKDMLKAQKRIRAHWKKPFFIRFIHFLKRKLGYSF